MDDKKKLAAETQDYIRGSVNGPVYVAGLDHPLLLKELAERVLNRRDWKHDLKTFKEVQEVVKTAAQEIVGEKVGLKEVG